MNALEEVEQQQQTNQVNNNQEDEIEDEEFGYDNDDLDDESRQRENVNLKCNEFKEEINRVRKYSLKALGFCSKLINDLELAARYEVRSTIQDLLDELKQSGHVLVNFTNPELNSSSFSTTPDSSASSFDHLMQHVTTTTGGVTNSSTSSLLASSINTSMPTPSSSTSPFMIFVPREFHKEKLQIIRLLFIISEKDEFDSKEKQAQSPERLLKQQQQRKFTSGGQQASSFSEELADQTERMLNSSIDSSISPPTKNLFNDTVFKASRIDCGSGDCKVFSSSTTSPAQPQLPQFGAHSVATHAISSSQGPKSPGGTTSFRRLSSSNSFVEMSNDNQVRNQNWIELYF